MSVQVGHPADLSRDDVGEWLLQQTAEARAAAGTCAVPRTRGVSTRGLMSDVKAMTVDRLTGPSSG
jgi:hypothetical protein